MKYLFQNWIKLLSIPFFTLVLFQSCTNKNRLDIDASAINVDVHYKRLDNDLYSSPINKDSVVVLHFKLLNQYPELYKAFVEVMLQEGYAIDTITAVRMLDFLSNKEIKEIYSAIEEEFPNQQILNEEFTEAFKHFKYHFPGEKIPNIIGFYSNYNAKTLLADSSIAIGLELYLGENHPITKRIESPNIPQYIKRKMDKNYLVSDALKYFLLNKYYQDNGEDFLSTIVSMGKIMYLLDALEPQKEDWKKMGYSQQQMEWCKDNEEQIWKYIIEEQLLFSVNQERINHFIDEAPFTKGLPQESPSMVGIWIGWQMVRDYMSENESVTLQQLIDETDSKKILKYYQPD